MHIEYTQRIKSWCIAMIQFYLIDHDKRRLSQIFDHKRLNDSETKAMHTEYTLDISFDISACLTQLDRKVG